MFLIRQDRQKRRSKEGKKAIAVLGGKLTKDRELSPLQYRYGTDPCGDKKGEGYTEKILPESRERRQRNLLDRKSNSALNRRIGGYFYGKRINVMYAGMFLMRRNRGFLFQSSRNVRSVISRLQLSLFMRRSGRLRERRKRRRAWIIPGSFQEKMKAAGI